MLPFTSACVLVSCSWCHAMNDIHGRTNPLCKDCGHRADVERTKCDCPKCSRTPEQRREDAEKNMADFLKRFDAAGGDLNKLLDADHDLGGES